MDYSEILQIITSVCPTISAVITLLIGFASLIRTIKAIKADSENTKDSINSVLVVADRHLYHMLFVSLSLSSFIILFCY